MECQNSLSDCLRYCTPFDPDFKYMATAVNKEAGGVRLLVKGAPEKIQATKMLKPNGSVESFDIDNFESTRKLYAGLTYRTLGIAYADFSDEEWAELEASHDGLVETKDRRKIDKDLTMIAMFGIQDPLRDGIKDAVGRLASAGVTTVMVTGDNIETAKAIAHSAGILSDADKEMVEKNPKIGELICMEGRDF